MRALAGMFLFAYNEALTDKDSYLYLDRPLFEVPGSGYTSEIGPFIIGTLRLTTPLLIRILGPDPLTTVLT